MRYRHVVRHRLFPGSGCTHRPGHMNGRMKVLMAATIGLPVLGVAMALLSLPSSAPPSTDVAHPDTPVDRAAFEHPVEGLTDAQRTEFLEGRSLVGQSWVIAPSLDDDVDGLGPLYNRLACESCHDRNGRGSAPADGAAPRSMLVRVSIPGHDAHGGPRPHPIYGTQIEDQAVPGVTPEARVRLHWENLLVTLKDGETLVLRRPQAVLSNPGHGPFNADLLTSIRVGQPLYGLGLLTAVPEATLKALQDPDDRNGDGISGRFNQVWGMAARQTVRGLFGWKANEPTLRQQIAGALSGDMGLTSFLNPVEVCPPNDPACRNQPTGGQPEISAAQLDAMTFYLSALEAPEPRHPDAPQIRAGSEIFRNLGCPACHVPTLKTGSEAPLPQLRDRTIHPYSDLLLHDMGPGLADGRPDYDASGSEWRTPPLWGLGLQEEIGGSPGYLHDGRARTASEAILWHGGEGQNARDAFAAAPRSQREALLAFLNSL